MTGRQGTIDVDFQPKHPGVLTDVSGPPVNWITRLITRGGLSQLQWTVMSSAGVAYGPWVTSSLFGGQCTIVVPFQSSGDYVAARSGDGAPIIAVSGQVTLRDPVTPTISIVPSIPGTIVASANGRAPWSTTVIVTRGITDIQWVVRTSLNVARSEWQTANLQGSSYVINVEFLAAGDYLFVSQLGNPAIRAYSSAAAISGAPSATITLTPSQPGTIQQSSDNTAHWTTTVTATGGLSQVQWGLFSSANTLYGTWSTLSLTNGQALLTVKFLNTSDYLVVQAIGNALISTSSTPVTVVAMATTISLTPVNPGTILTGSPWTTQISETGGLTQVQWGTFSLAGAQYGGWNVLTLINGIATLAVYFIATGDTLQVTKVGDTSVAAISGQVNLTPLQQATVNITPSQPGTIQMDSLGGAPWLTNITGTGLTQVQWQVFTSANAGRGGWAVLPLVNGVASLAVEFLATGDYLQAAQIGNPAVSATSGAVTILEIANAAAVIPMKFDASGSAAAAITAVGSVKFPLLQSGTTTSANQYVGDVTIPITVHAVGTEHGTDVAASPATSRVLNFSASGTMSNVGVDNGNLLISLLRPSGTATASNAAHGSVTFPGLSSVTSRPTQVNAAHGTVSPVAISATGTISQAVTTVTMSPTAPGTLSSTSPTWQTTLSATGSLTSVNTQVFSGAGVAYPGAPVGHFLTPLPIGKSTPGDITLSASTLGPYTAGTTVSIGIVSTQSTLEYATFNGGSQVNTTGTALISGGSVSIAATLYENSDYIGVWSSATLSDICYTNPVVISTAVPPPAAQTPKTTLATITFFNTGDYVVVSDPLNGAVNQRSNAVTISTAAAMTLNPYNPGAVLPGQVWTTTLSTVGITSIEYVNQSYPGNVFYSNPTVVALNGSGEQSTVISTTFANTGDYLTVLNTNNTAQTVSSWSCTIVASETLTLNPVNPGTLSASNPSWTTHISTYPALSQAQWAIFTASNVAESGWNTIGLTSGQADLTVAFQNSGDYLQVTQVGTISPAAVSGVVSMTAGQSIHLNPQNPGTLSAGSLGWSTVVTVLDGNLPVYVQSASSTPQSATASCAASFATTQTLGNAIIVLIGWNDSTSTVTSVTDSHGASYALVVGPTRNSGNASQSIYATYNIASGSNTITVAFSTAVNFPDLRIAEYANIGVAEASSGSSGSSLTPSTALTTLSSTDLVIGGAYVASGVASVPNGWNEQLVTTPDASNLQDTIVTVPGAVTVSSTQSSTGWWVISAAAFKPSGNFSQALPTQVQWAVFNNNLATTAWSTLPLTVKTGTATATLNVTFANAGDYLVVEELPPNTGIIVSSGKVSVTTGGGGGGGGGVLANASPVDMTGWSIVFEDDFTGTTLNTANWGTWGNNTPISNSQLIGDTSSYSVSNGALNLNYYYDGANWRGPNFQAGGVNQAGFFGASNPGVLPYRSEFKALIPNNVSSSNPVGPYFCMWPYENLNWENEYDIAEFIYTPADQFIQTYHFNGCVKPDASITFNAANRSTVPHIYTVECNPANPSPFRFWLDGTELTSQLPPNGNAGAWNVGPGAITNPMVPGIGSVAWGAPPGPSFTCVVNYWHIWVPSGGGSSDLAKAQAFAANLKLGFNIEREHWMSLTYNGNPIANSTAYWSYMLGLGFTHVRFYISYGFSGAGTSQTQSDLQNFYTPISNAIAAGLKVIMELSDVLGYSEWTANQATLQSWWSASGTTIAGWGLPTTMLAVGAIQEYAGDSNANWNPVMQTAANLLRAKLPGYIISLGAANWKSYGGSTALNSYDNSAGLCDGTFTPWPDMLAIYDVHNTDQSGSPNNTADYSNCVAAISAWQSANGHRPVYQGEVYPISGSWTPGDMTGYGSGSGQYAPTFWTVTTGNGDPLNNSSTDAAIPSALASAIQSANAAIATQSYFGNGAIR